MFLKKHYLTSLNYYDKLFIGWWIILINREKYLLQLLDYKDTKTIKVITGMRRCGKSTLVKLFIQYLLEHGIGEDHIIYINFESLRYDEYKDYMKLYKYISQQIKDNKKYYIALDEIQQVTSWEKTVNSLAVDFNVDIYITGSNAYLLSSELSTLLSGRYVEIKMLPLSFKEYLIFDKKNDKDLKEKFEEYLKYGALPVLFEHKKNDSIFNNLLLGIYNTVLVKDVIERNKMNDVILMDNIVRFALDNIGNIISSKKISDYMSSDGKKTTHITVLNYLKMLENAYILYPVRRYDLKGKNYLKTLEKYYVVDIGIRNAVLGYRNVDKGHILENIVYLELLRKGYEVCIGKYKDYEIDFVVTKPDCKKYYQVTQTIANEEVLNRECRSLEAINDNYEKIILSMDNSYIVDRNGIKFQNILDFLLED